MNTVSSYWATCLRHAVSLRVVLEHRHAAADERHDARERGQPTDGAAVGLGRGRRQRRQRRPGPRLRGRLRGGGD